MKDLAKRLAAALRPFAVDVYKPIGKNGFSIAVAGGVVHEAREAVRQYDETHGILEARAGTAEGLINVQAQRDALIQLLTACRKVKGGEIAPLVKPVEEAFAPLLAEVQSRADVEAGPENE